MPPTVEVIIATNRVGPHLAEAIASVLAQDWTDWRLTVVDDGVPDPDLVPRLVSGLHDVRVVRQENQGLAAARNAGIRATTGELLVFLDDDDVWSPTRLGRQVRALEARPDAVGSYTGGWYMDAQGRAMEGGWTADSGTAGQMRRLEVPLPRITTLMVRRADLAAVGDFDERFRAAEDIDVALRLLDRGGFVPVDAPLVGYRRHDENMTRTMSALSLARLVDRVFAGRIDAARAAGEADAVKDLCAGRARARGKTAAELPGRLRVHMRDRRFGEAARDAAWSLRSSPRGVAAGLGRSVVRRSPRRRFGR